MVERTRSRPTPLRVARRALVFAEITMRAYLEREGAPDTADYLRRTQAWLADHDLEGELEASERRQLFTVLGRLAARQVETMLWRSEALGVLAWSLRQGTLSPHDEETDPQAVSKKLGFMKPSPTVLKAPALRPATELERLAGTLRLIHWRLREVHLRRQPVDLAAFAAGGPLGRIDLASVPLVDGDLSVGGRAILRATAATLRNCLSIAAERHQAINWLRGDDPVYSRVDTPT